MPTKKQAVDATAEEYYGSYFGDYGRAWTRSIPKRVANALLPRTAAQGAAEPTDVHVAPLAHVINASGLVLEGVLRASVNGQPMQRLFKASFNHEGSLLTLDSVPA